MTCEIACGLSDCQGSVVCVGCAPCCGQCVDKSTIEEFLHGGAWSVGTDVLHVAGPRRRLQPSQLSDDQHVFEAEQGHALLDYWLVAALEQRGALIRATPKVETAGVEGLFLFEASPLWPTSGSRAVRRRTRKRWRPATPRARQCIHLWLRAWLSRCGEACCSHRRFVCLNSSPSSNLIDQGRGDDWRGLSKQ